MESMSVEEARDLLMKQQLDEQDAEDFDEKASAVLPDDAIAAQAIAAQSPHAEANAAHQIADAAAQQEESTLFDDNGVGLGVDIVEIQRMQRLLDRTPSFAQRVYSPAEYEYCQSKANPATHFALRFAAKEAVVKALGTGFACGIGVRDIEVVRAKSGKPQVKLSGRALEVSRERGVRELSLSLSHTHTNAVACAMAVTEASLRASEKRKDPMQELARQFKETRGILDEL